MASAEASRMDQPRNQIRRRVSPMKPNMLAWGLARLTTPTISPRLRMGAPTCMMEERSSASFVRVERAPYWPSKVRLTSW